MFHISKAKNKVENERIRRGLKKNESIFQNNMVEGSRVDMSRANVELSLSLLKGKEFPLFLQKKKSIEVKSSNP